MEKVLSFLSQNWIGSLIGLIGIITAYIFYKKSRTFASLSCQSQSLKIIEKSKRLVPKNVEILFDGKTVDRITKNIIVLWNSGRTTIRGSDIIPEDPLRIEFNTGTQVLQVRILKFTREANKFTPKIREEERHIVDLSFYYLDQEDGVSMEILHTGEKPDFNILGTIRGLPRGINNLGSFDLDGNKINLLIGLIAHGIPITFGFYMIYIIIKAFTKGNYKGLASIIIIALMSLFVIYSQIMEIRKEWKKRQKFPSILKISKTEFYK